MKQRTLKEFNMMITQQTKGLRVSATRIATLIAITALLASACSGTDGTMTETEKPVHAYDY